MSQRNIAGGSFHSPGGRGPPTPKPRPKTGNLVDVAKIDPMKATPTQGRNDPCACGSGTKFKRCCGVEPSPMGHHFDCDRCGRHFKTGRPPAEMIDAEALAEAKRLFPEEVGGLDNPEERASVCEDCWKAMDIRTPVRTRIVKVQLSAFSSDDARRALVYDWLREFEYETEKPEEVAPIVELLGPDTLIRFFYATIDKQGRFAIGSPAPDQVW